MGWQGKVRAGLNWLVVAAVVWQGGKWGVEGQVHHVVGDDRGWDLTSADIAAWAATRTFAVGDFICTYTTSLSLSLTFSSFFTLAIPMYFVPPL